MRQRALAAFLLGATVLGFGGQTARAQDPDADAIFERCVAKVRKAVTRCTNANTETTKECLRKIRYLLRVGHEERARALAARCIEEIEVRTRHCVRHIKATCEECIDVLLRIGAPELARRLHRICHNAVDEVNHNARHGIHAIRSAFD